MVFIFFAKSMELFDFASLSVYYLLATMSRRQEVCQEAYFSHIVFSSKDLRSGSVLVLWSDYDALSAFALSCESYAFCAVI